MQTRSPFSFLSGIAPGSWSEATWIVDETQQRIVLLINHVLMQEPEAMRRLTPSQGKRLLLRWGRFYMSLAVTAAGLFDRCEDSAVQAAPHPGAASQGQAPGNFPTADLSITLTQDSPWELAQFALSGQRPALRIEGDADFASDINWLVDHVRWDVEEDLSRIFGDAPARAIAATAQRIFQALREFAPSNSRTNDRGAVGPQ